MKRLTIKNEYELTKSEYPYRGLSLNPKIYEKLGKLEDLEEKINIPLETMFNLIGNRIYIVDETDNSYIPYTINVFFKDNDMLGIGYADICGLDMSAYFEDYNKTWFATEEEAKRKLEVMKNEQ